MRGLLCSPWLLADDRGQSNSWKYAVLWLGDNMFSGHDTLRVNDASCSKATNAYSRPSCAASSSDILKLSHNFPAYAQKLGRETADFLICVTSRTAGQCNIAFRTAPLQQGVNGSFTKFSNSRHLCILLTPDSHQNRPAAFQRLYFILSLAACSYSSQATCCSIPPAQTAICCSTPSHA